MQKDFRSDGVRGHDSLKKLPREGAAKEKTASWLGESQAARKRPISNFIAAILGRLVAELQNEAGAVHARLGYRACLRRR